MYLQFLTPSCYWIPLFLSQHSVSIKWFIQRTQKTVQRSLYFMKYLFLFFSIDGSDKQGISSNIMFSCFYSWNSCNESFLYTEIFASIFQPFLTIKITFMGLWKTAIILELISWFFWITLEYDNESSNISNKIETTKILILFQYFLKCFGCIPLPSTFSKIFIVAFQYYQFHSFSFSNLILIIAFTILLVISILKFTLDYSVVATFCSMFLLPFWER